ncbi:Hsp20/alpha crystallin family protein [Natrarchaeobius chitinivorans]|uniref:Hsp20/alpha crystallin family protein n=1 Tax=Natrarchaeobius chitinivorans TaxID=1679083 RepID=A0A3N6MJP3_NATCH|nr:Hsp20/alpha crystallin family protein [Natrarchaeobius chitinivorans]RQG94436.1 Hsp20/alpha crystallin family protein [Natrarchaeobius chitinivorans]
MSALRDALRDLSEDVFFDLLESDDAYLLVVDVPGVTADALEVSAEDGHLGIEAQREKDLPGEYRYLEENRSIFFDVELPVPEDALEGEADVSVDRGVLELTIPKRSKRPETTIDVVERDSNGSDRDVDGPDSNGSDRDITERDITDRDADDAADPQDPEPR